VFHQKTEREIFTITDTDLYFEQARMGGMIAKLQSKAGRSRQKLYELITKYQNVF